MYRFVVSVLIGALLAFILTLQTSCVTTPPAPPPGCQVVAEKVGTELLAAGYTVTDRVSGNDYILYKLIKAPSDVALILVSTPNNKAKSVEQGFESHTDCLMPDGALSFVAVLKTQVPSMRAGR